MTAAFIPATRRPLRKFGSAIPHRTDPLPVLPLITERPRRLMRKELREPACPVCGERRFHCDCGDAA